MQEELKRRKILIADDSELNREMLTEILGDGYDYIYAEDGKKALGLMEKSTDVDILLLDMNMPVLSGMQVLKVMREKNWLDEIPVVIISAENDDNFIKNAYYLGASDYIVRPFNAFLVQHRVKNTLMMYAQKKQLASMVEEQIFRREKINNMMITIFSHVVELGNSESGSHTVNIQAITNMLLKRLVSITDKYDLSEGDIAMISSVSSLHDIGKIMVPDEILNKPGRLTDEEWEFMKAHTVNGDEFLKNIPIDQNEGLMITAHEICRHHHERWDGGGYPDGLSGDEIPISAQAVSVADVYDALTSDRCYKKAYTHEKALEMIFGGECGAFNPLLLQCLKDISDGLFVNLKMLNSRYGAEKSSYSIANEMLENKNPSLSERYLDIAVAEQKKKEFFQERCVGIQFEYDAVMKQVSYIKYLNREGEAVSLQSSVTQLLTESDWERLNSAVKSTTRQSPDVKMTALVPINGNLRWHTVHVRTVWTEKNSSYVSVIGQFTDIHDTVLKKSAEFMLDGKEISADSILAMCDIFDVVRIVNPNSCEAMKVDENGKLINTGYKCFKLWGRDEACKLCTSLAALENKKWMGKLELKDGVLYSVLSRYIQYNGELCVLEVAFCIDDTFEKAQSEIGFYPDSMAIKSFYRDALTKTYSRAYVERFMPNLEKADGIAIADIDEFKSINDTYGHTVGDAALVHISSVIQGCIRKEDALIRYGGDEFLLVFDSITKEDFFEKLEAIKKAVHESRLEQYPDVNHDISIGGAYGVHPFEKAVDTADKAMYKDKFRNKNWENK